MIDGKWFAYMKATDTSAWRIYFWEYTKTPPELLGTSMEKERYLNALAKKTLRVTGVHPQHG